MANRFWVGGSGNWDVSTTTNWSTTSGGAGGASAPTNTDNVFVDANSGSSPIITVTSNLANCLDLTFTGAITPTLTGAKQLGVCGSLTFIATMTVSGLNLNMASTTTGKTITTAGLLLNVAFTFTGVGGGWTLQDDLNVAGLITLTNGTFITNGKAITCAGFNSSNANVRTLTLGASNITTSSDWTFTTTTNLTFSVGTSTITLTGATTTFAGGGLTYKTVNFTGTPTTMTGSNTFTNLTIAAGKTLKLTFGTTQTITSLVCNGTLANPSTLQAVTGGSAATIALPAGRYFIRHTSIKDITITGATAVTSIAGTNVSGNTGITFVSKFEMGRIKNDGSFNWYSAATGTVDKISG